MCIFGIKKSVVSLWMVIALMMTSTVFAQQASFALDVKKFSEISKESIIVDTRPSADFLKGFIDGSISIGWQGPFNTWIQKIVDDKTKSLILVTVPGTEQAVMQRLDSLGYTAVKGYLANGMDAWLSADRPIVSLPNVTAEEAMALNKDENYIYVDVRSAKEFEAGHVAGALNMPLQNYYYEMKSEPHITYLLQCQVGYRSTLAASILYAKGVKNIKNVDGGYKAVSAISQSKK